MTTAHCAQLTAAALGVMFLALPAAADCTCRALGRDFELGHAICLATPDGPRRAICGMVLNNTSWHVSGTPCVLAAGDPARVTGLAPDKLPRPAPFEAQRTQSVRSAPPGDGEATRSP